MQFKEFYEQLPIGARAWVPCAGISSLEIETGHVGRVDTYKGNGWFARGEWIKQEQAELESKEGLVLSSSSTLCKDCARILAEAKK